MESTPALIGLFESDWQWMQLLLCDQLLRSLLLWLPLIVVNITVILVVECRDFSDGSPVPRYVGRTVGIQVTSGESPLFTHMYTYFESQVLEIPVWKRVGERERESQTETAIVRCEEWDENSRDDSFMFRFDYVFFMFIHLRGQQLSSTPVHWIIHCTCVNWNCWHRLPVNGFLLFIYEKLMKHLK